MCCILFHTLSLFSRRYGNNFSKVDRLLQAFADQLEENSGQALALGVPGAHGVHDRCHGTPLFPPSLHSPPSFQATFPPPPPSHLLSHFSRAALFYLRWLPKRRCLPHTACRGWGNRNSVGWATRPESSDCDLAASLLHSQSASPAARSPPHFVLCGPAPASGMRQGARLKQQQLQYYYYYGYDYDYYD